MDKKNMIIIASAIVLFVILIGLFVVLIKEDESITEGTAKTDDQISTVAVVTTEATMDNKTESETVITTEASTDETMDETSEENREETSEMETTTRSSKKNKKSKKSKKNNNNKPDNNKPDNNKPDNNKPDQNNSDINKQDNYLNPSDGYDTENSTGLTNPDHEYTFRNNKKLEDHYEKHGKEMGFKDAGAYEEAASNVVNNPNVLHKIEKEDGDDVYYIESTNEFVIVSTDGYIRTYFNPSGGIDYYNRQ